MPSQINYEDIDANFPVAGQDNDSQGFRDNFSTIKTSFQDAQSEISELQLNAAKLNVSNDFQGEDQEDLNLVKSSYKATIKSVVNGTYLNFNTGHYQIVTIDASVTTGSTVTMVLDNFLQADTEKVRRMNVIVYSNGNSGVLANFSLDSGTLKKQNFSVGVTLSTTVTTAHEFEFTAIGSTEVLARYIGAYTV